MVAARLWGIRRTTPLLLPLLHLLTFYSAHAQQVAISSSATITNTNITTTTNISSAAATSNDHVNGQDDEDIRIAVIFDTTNYPWAMDVITVTFQLINDGWWDILPKDGTRKVTYQVMDSKCDPMESTRAYWTLFHQHKHNIHNNHTIYQRPFHAIVGPRCSGAGIAIGRFAGLEGIPLISPTTNSATLSDKSQFPYYNRMLLPADERGHVGATISFLRRMEWNRIGILSTDTAYSKTYVRNFRKAWIGKHDGGNWVGTVALDVSFNVDEDTNMLNMELVTETLASAATIGEKEDEDPKVIMIVSHEEHQVQILQEAYRRKFFSPSTIWVGIYAGWANQVFADSSSIPIPPIPGWFEIGPRLNNRDPHYQRFLAALRLYQINNQLEVYQELPTYSEHTVDAIRAMVTAVANTPNATEDSWAVVQTLRNLTFDGVGGRIEFNRTTGDPLKPVYSILNAQSADAAGRIEWKDIGLTSTKLGTAHLTHGLESVCWAVEGCGLAVPPDDTFPPPEQEAPLWAILLFCILGVTLLAFCGLAWKYRAIRKAKATIEQELESFRESVVGMRTAECNYIPLIQQAQPATIPEDESGHFDRRLTGRPSLQHLVSFRRTNSKNNGMANSSRRGAPFRESLMASIARQLQLQLPNDGGDSTDIRLGQPVPLELEKEPRLVLVEGDVIQIKSQRLDGWGFGTKLYHADEETERQLVTLALMNIASEDVEGRVSVETGWMEIDKTTRDPTKEDLELLHQAVGDESLDPPSHWEPMSGNTAATVQRFEIERGKQEREQVLRTFMATLPDSTVIQSVQRIQNLALWQSYVVKRRAVYHRETGRFPRDDNKDEQAKTLRKIERKWVFHGCDSDVVDKIAQQGFNRSFCGKNATLYGKGVYFARDSAYSSATVYARPDEDGCQYILACRVVVGEYCLGKEDALTPDVRDAASQALYDSTVDNVEDPTLFVTYHDAQAYPEYLIAFQIPEGGDLALLHRELEQERGNATNDNTSSTVPKPAVLYAAEGVPVHVEGTTQQAQQPQNMGPEGRPLAPPQTTTQQPRYGAEGQPMAPPPPTQQPIRYGAEGQPLAPPPTTQQPVRYGAEGQPLAPPPPTQQPIRYGAEGQPLPSSDPHITVRYGAEGKPFPLPDIDEENGTLGYGAEAKAIVIGGKTQQPQRFGPEGKPILADGYNGGRPSMLLGPEGRPVLIDGQKSVRFGAEGKPILADGFNGGRPSILIGAEGRPILIGEQQSVRFGAEGKPMLSEMASIGYGEGSISTRFDGRRRQQPMWCSGSALSDSGVNYGAQATSMDGQQQLSPTRGGPEGKCVRYGPEGQILDVESTRLNGLASPSRFGAEGQLLNVQQSRSVPRSVPDKTSNGSEPEGRVINDGTVRLIIEEPAMETESLSPRSSVDVEAEKSTLRHSLDETDETAAETEDNSEEMTAVATG